MEAVRVAHAGHSDHVDMVESVAIHSIIMFFDRLLKVFRKDLNRSNAAEIYAFAFKSNTDCFVSHRLLFTAFCSLTTKDSIRARPVAIFIYGIKKYKHANNFLIDGQSVSRAIDRKRI